MMKALAKAIENTPHSEATAKVEKQFDEILKLTHDLRVDLEEWLEELDRYVSRIEQREAA